MPLKDPAPAAWLQAGGEMSQLIRAKDWSETSLGPLDTWPQILRSVTGMMLASRAQIILFWGPDFTVLYNDAYRPVFALKHPWALGKPGREAWREVWPDQLAVLLDGVVTSGEAFSASDLPFLVERNGYREETYFDISYDPVRDESGKVAGVYCIVSETTGRVIGERRLKMLRELGKATAEAKSGEDVFTKACDVLARWDKDISFGLAYEWDEATRSGRRVAQAQVPDDAAWAPEILDPTGAWPVAEAINAGGSILEQGRLESIGNLPGGGWPESAKCAALMPLEISGQGTKAVLILGVSPRRPFDDQYFDFLRLVAASIASGYSNALALEAERRRAEALRELDRAKTAFFSNVSREFRTPLTLLLSPLEDALAGNGLSADLRPRIEMAHRNSLRLLKLVNNLLDFSRIEAGRAKASFEPTDLARATTELASNFSSACERAGLALSVRCDPLARPVWVDRDMWEKIVLNLVSNAFKFTFEGTIGISLVDAGDGAVLRVSDTGVGIPASELPHVFDRFHRVEGTRVRTHEGSGIGLALVHDLVELLGGRIELASVPDQGTCFTVTLPYGSAHLPREQLATLPRQAPDSTRVRAFVEAPQFDGDTRILVVDDSAEMRDHISRQLRDYWSVELAPDGEAALERLRARHFDVVITDVMMPKLDGFGLLRAIREDSRIADVSVIMLSARAGEESRIEGLEAGADDYLVKPFGTRELVAQVRSQVAIRRMRGEARSDRSRLVEVLGAAPNPIVILRGPKHTIELANEAACRIWGRNLDDVVRKPLFEALPEVAGKGFEAILDAVFQSGKPYHGRALPRPVGRDGQEIVYLNFYHSALRAPDGTIEGVLATSFDVTEEVLARRQIEDLRVKAEEANRTKDAFLAMLGHELRNPLSPIVGALKLMRLRGLDSPEIDILERQAGHLTRLVDDLLDVSRIARGRLDLHRRPVDIAEVIRRAMDMASPLIQDRKHAMELHLPPGPLAVLGDTDRLAQIVTNLLTNAAKYSDPGSRIVVACRSEGERVMLSVEDEGIGIAPEMRSRIFELFVQQDQTIDRSEGGLGLGLAIVKSLVEMHGGSVRVEEASSGKGSRFVLDLPAAGALGPTEHVAPVLALARAKEPMRVLLVDDNEDAVRTLGESLRLMGHSVQVAHDGEEALEAAARFTPEVALIDIGLPRMDGYELAKRMRLLQTPPQRLFAVTGYGLETDRQRSLGAGFHRHFVKPVDVIELDDAIAYDAKASVTNRAPA